jgi:guanylate kinase
MFSISCTTRPPRAAEIPGKWYDFISEAEFDRRVSEGDFLEHARVFGKHQYGTPRKWVEEAGRKGLDVVLEIDVQGAEQVKRQLPDSVAIFILPPSREELERRLRARSSDSDEAIRRRLDQARQEIQRYTEYDFLVVNDDIERAGREVKAIAVGARCLRKNMDSRARIILQSFGG